MDYEVYRDDATRFHKPNERSVREQNPLHGLVGLVRQLGGKDNKYLYHDVFPFSVESGAAFPLYEDEGPSRVKSVLTDIKRGSNFTSIPTFLAWLWYRHEDQARVLYDKYGFAYHPYVGEPNLDSCPKVIADRFEFRSSSNTRSADFENKTSISELHERLLERLSTIRGSLLVVTFVVAAIVILLTVLGFQFSKQEAYNPQGSPNLAPLNLSKFKSNTFCVFPEKNISLGKNLINGEIVDRLDTPFVFDPSEGDYFHATENVNVFGAWDASGYVENKIDLFSRGRLVEISRSESNGFSGLVAEQTIFTFEIDKDTGKYTYAQFDYLDQPTRSEKGYFITLSFEYHLHREGKALEERFVQIDVYDSEHNSLEANINGIRE